MRSSYNQVEKVFEKLKEFNFGDIQALELIRRDIQLKKNAIRPNTRMIGHTGYITFARLVEDIENPYRSKKPKNEEFVNLNGMPLRSWNNGN